MAGLLEDGQGTGEEVGKKTPCGERIETQVLGGAGSQYRVRERWARDTITPCPQLNNRAVVPVRAGVTS